jgi:hypothetical protein
VWKSIQVVEIDPSAAQDVGDSAEKSKSQDILRVIRSLP